MSEYKTILVAIDLYGSPEQVLARATNIAGQQASTVHVLNVIPDPTSIYFAYPELSASTLNFDREALRDEMRARMSKLTQQVDIPQANLIAMVGNVTRVILEQAQQLEADLIIVGSHGRRGIQRLLGSTANGVLHRADCDVLSVRISAAEQAEK